MTLFHSPQYVYMGWEEGRCRFLAARQPWYPRISPGNSKTFSHRHLDQDSIQFWQGSMGFLFSWINILSFFIPEKMLENLNAYPASNMGSIFLILREGTTQGKSKKSRKTPGNFCNNCNCPSVSRNYQEILGSSIRIPGMSRKTSRNTRIFQEISRKSRIKIWIIPIAQ